MYVSLLLRHMRGRWKPVPDSVTPSSELLVAQVNILLPLETTPYDNSRLLQSANNLVAWRLGTSMMFRIQSLSQPFRIPSAILSRSPLPTIPFRSVSSLQSTKPALWRLMWRDLSITVGTFSRRPMLGMMRSQNPEFSRGMKVRTSVKKFCDGCKVSKLSSHLLCWLLIKADQTLEYRAFEGRAVFTSSVRTTRNISSDKVSDYSGGNFLSKILVRYMNYSADPSCTTINWIFERFLFGGRAFCWPLNLPIFSPKLHASFSVHQRAQRRSHHHCTTLHYWFTYARFWKVSFPEFYEAEQAACW